MALGRFPEQEGLVHLSLDLDEKQSDICVNCHNLKVCEYDIQIKEDYVDVRLVRRA